LTEEQGEWQMSKFDLEEFIEQLRAAARGPEAKAGVRALMHDAFQYPQAIKAAMPEYEGAEDNHFYLREPDRLVYKSSRRVDPGDVIALKPDGIHSVKAADGKPCCGIHVYLAVLTTIERSLFDWDSGAACRYTDENYELMKRVTV